MKYNRDFYCSHQFVSTLCIQKMRFQQLFDTFSDMVTEVKLRHLTKANVSIVVTEGGIEMDVKPVHSWNN